MKTGLVLEGGAMRGIFSAGIMDVLMEGGIWFDGAVGTSAGAAFGCNFKSRQIGRVIRYNKKFCRDPRYASLRSWVMTGDLFNARFSYEELPQRLDPFDVETFRRSPMEFYAVCTDVRTGKAVYHQCEDGGADDIAWIRASASMPLASRVVNLQGQLLSDGGTADSIPIRFFQQLGYDRCVVILTQPLGFVKRRSRLMPILALALRKYPALVRALKERPEAYNLVTKFIREQELAGKLLVFRPDAPLGIGAVVRDPNELERVYQLGRNAALRRLEEVKAFLTKKKSLS